METYKKMLKLLNDHNEIYTSLFGERQKEKTEVVTIKILKEVPTFVGTDMQEYGPFSEGQKVDVPQKISKLLVLRKIAEEV